MHAAGRLPGPRQASPAPIGRCRGDRSSPLGLDASNRTHSPAGLALSRQGRGQAPGLSSDILACCRRGRRVDGGRCGPPTAGLKSWRAGPGSALGVVLSPHHAWGWCCASAAALHVSPPTPGPGFPTSQVAGCDDAPVGESQYFDTKADTLSDTLALPSCSVSGGPQVCILAGCLCGSLAGAVVGMPEQESKSNK